MDDSDCKALAAPDANASDTSSFTNASIGNDPSPPGGHVMAFSRTLRQKLRNHGFRPVSTSSEGRNNGSMGRQVSESPSTSSRVVTVVQNIYVYVSGSGGPTTHATVLARPLRLRPPKPSDDAFLDDDNPSYQACCHKCHVTRSAFIIGLVELVFAAMNLVDAIRHVAITGRVLPSLFELLFAIAFAVAVVLMIIGVRTERKSFLMPHLVWSIIFVVIGLLVIVTIVVAWFFAGSMLAWTLATAESNVQSKFDTIEAKTRMGGVNGSRVEFNNDEDDDADYFQPPAAVKEIARRLRRQTDEELDDDKKESKAVKNVLWGIVLLLVGVFLLCVGLEIWFFLIIRACYHYLRDKELYLARLNFPDGANLVKALPTLVEREENEL